MGLYICTRVCIIYCVLSPGYEAIFQSLENVQGSVEAKKSFAKDIIKEAERFRKKQLIQHLEDWVTKLSPIGSNNKTDVGRSGSSITKNNSRHTGSNR